jgi:hypothetical protein
MSKDPEFRANTTTDKTVADEKGYIQTRLPALQHQYWGNRKPLYMDPRLAWALDDFMRPGFSDSTLQGPRNAANALINTMFVLQPLVHPLNELSLWGTQRGFRWMQPGKYRDLVETGARAINSVLSQDTIQRDMRAHGAALLYPSVANGDVIAKMAQRFGFEAQQNGKIWGPIARQFGTDIPKIAQQISKGSQKLMWGLSDMLYTQRVLEYQREGMSLDQAINEAGRFMSTYRVDPSLGLGTATGRVLQQAMTDRSLSFFGPYHAGLWRTFLHMGQRALGPDATPAQRKQALGQLLVMGVGAFFLYPAMDAAYEKLTGNEGGAVGRRGLNTILGQNFGEDPLRVATKLGGTDRNRGNVQDKPENTFKNVWVPSNIVDAAEGIRSNTDDFTGKKVAQPGAGFAMQQLQRAEWLAKNLIPPIGTAETVMRQPGAGIWDLVGHELGEQFGLKNPSPAANRYEAQLGRNEARDMRARAKHPPGVVEGFFSR